MQHQRANPRRPDDPGERHSFPYYWAELTWYLKGRKAAFSGFLLCYEATPPTEEQKGARNAWNDEGNAKTNTVSIARGAPFN